MKHFIQKDVFRFTIWTLAAILAAQAILRAADEVTYLREILALAALAAVPILLVLAWTGWVRAVRREMPAWRNGLALSALVIPFLQWGLLANLVLGTHHPLDPSVMYVDFLMPQASLIALALVVALKRAPRIQTMLACVLMMLVSALATYV